MTNFHALAEAALDSPSAFAFIPESKHGGPFLVSVDGIILGRVARAGIPGIPGTGQRMYDAFDMTGQYIGCESGLCGAAGAIEVELRRRRASGEDWLTGIKKFDPDEIGA